MNVCVSPSPTREQFDMKTLLAEDSESLQRTLSAGLRHSGYSVDQAFDGEEALRYLQANQYDVVVLDIMMPKLDGVTLLKKIRSQGDSTPVLILSARDTTEDRICGLDLGADDYLVKPFSFEELLSRLRALTRRTNAKDQSISSITRFGELTINSIERKVEFKSEPVLLTPNEYRILDLLARRCGQVFSHDQLIDRLYSCEQDVTRNVIEVHVSSLRRKLRAAGSKELIMTRRGFGYYMAAPQS